MQLSNSYLNTIYHFILKCMTCRTYIKKVLFRIEVENWPSPISPRLIFIAYFLRLWVTAPFMKYSGTDSTAVFLVWISVLKHKAWWTLTLCIKTFIQNLKACFSKWGPHKGVFHDTWLECISSLWFNIAK